jgi:hypothetical protein
MKIAVLDDDESRSERWVSQLRSCEAIGEEHRIMSIDGDEFHHALEELERRRDLARSTAKNRSIDPIDIDEIDVLIVDYDLYDLGRIESSKPRLRVTGEEVAYLVRCYSSCRTIVGLNQFGENIFDLTLQGHPESFADLNIGSSQLHNPNLWGGRVIGFRPWVWPNLLAEPARLEARIQWLEERMQKPILQELGLGNAHEVGALSREALRFLGRGDPQEITFSDFVRLSGQGLDRKDEALDDPDVARIAAARVGKWLERLVLAGQDILVDAPHLVSRFPSLIADHHVGAWNEVTKLGTPPARLGLSHEALEEAVYRHVEWLSRPVWYWQRLFEDSRIDEVRDPWSSDPPPYVFCEDVSAFVDPALAREFTAAVPSVYVSRYVVDIDAAKENGAPLVESDSSISDIDYEPSVQFAL